jgi:hypothetical protein
LALSFTAQVRGWSNKAKQNALRVVQGSCADVAELATRTQPSVKVTGGMYREGFLAVDTGELLNSQIVGINGNVVGSGQVSYAALVLGMELGDVFDVGFTAPHAPYHEYGVPGRFGGRFYVRNAVQQWPVIVEQNAVQFVD